LIKDEDIEGQNREIGVESKWLMFLVIWGLQYRPTELVAARMEVVSLENDDDVGFGNGNGLFYQQISNFKSFLKLDTLPV